VTSERWQKVKTVLEDVLELAMEKRAAFLDAACQGEPEVRREVESLLASETEIGDFIETPVFRIRPEEEASLSAGRRIGVYRVVREIGRGGMGSVYLAERADEEFERRVAIKVIRRGMDTEEIVRRFRSERQILAHLDHENIAKLLDGGTTEDGRPYFVMEHVEGRPIDQECDARKLPVRRRLELFRQVCSAVHFAHQNLVVHRDLKPGNILVTAAGVPKLLDFGIAKLLDADQPAALTRIDLRPMTPEYASPEQVRGEPITTASDVYSLGVLLYNLLTGHPPYRQSTRDPLSLVQAICEENPVRPSSVIGRVEEVKKTDGSTATLTPESVSELRNGEPRALRSQLAGDLDNIVLKAMSKEPQRRYASADQLSDDIGRHLEGLPVVARKDTLGYRTAKFVGRHKVGVSLAAAVLLLIVGFSVTVTFLWRRAEREKTRAETVAAFLEDVFSVSNPSESRGETVTARELLDTGAKKIDNSLQGQPTLQADLMETMGRVYRKVGLFDAARPLLERALRLHRETLGNDDLLVAQDLHNLASLLHELRKDADSESLIREALGIQRRHGETKNIDYAKGLTNLGALLEDQGKLDEAEALYKESLAIKQTLPGVGEEDIATSLNDLGKLRETRGDYAAAESYYGESLKIRQKLAKGKPDPEVATSLNNLAALLEDQGDLAGAEALHRQALEMRRRLFGNRNYKVASSLSNLAHVFQTEGRAAAAEPLYREAVSIAEETLGKDHFSRGVMLRNLASVLIMEGKASEGEARAREALAIFRAKTPDSWRVADAESVLGGCLAAQRRFAEAEPLLTASYPILAKDPGDGAKHAPEALKRIVDLYTAWGKPEKAAEYQGRL
jgi:serine/threonine protein kinase/tetratricopeptide (TPR) repeat protein